MPNQRANGQEMVNLWVSSNLLDAIDEGRSRKGGISRSQFIRDAIAAALLRVGLHVPLEEVVAPDRAKPRPPYSKNRNILNEDVNSAPSDLGEGPSVADVEKVADREIPILTRKRKVAGPSVGKSGPHGGA